MNLVKSYHNYLHVYKTNLDLKKLEDSCKQIKDYVQNALILKDDKQSYIPKSTRTFEQYNLTQFVFSQTHEVYEAITKVANKHITNWSTNWWTQCWLNWYQEGEFVHWHNHGISNPKSLHGFVCVHTKDSHTAYQLKDGTEFNVQSKDGYLMVSQSDGDKHSTQPWEYKQPRITLAFDVAPESEINPYDFHPNHWTPLLRLETN